MISNSGHDERGRLTGGVSGDQSGTEWQIRTWYNRPWNCILRHPDENVREKIADLAKKAANNSHIGYNQAKRTSFWFALEKVNYDPSKIKTDCDSDCSAGVTAICKAVGFLLKIRELKDLSITNYTGSMKPNFKVAGFEVLTDEKYLTSDKYLVPGDILLNEKHHTCINLDYGSEVKKIVSGWIYDRVEGKWWYSYEDGTYPKSEWMEYKDRWYYFDAKGWCLTNQYIKSADYKSNGKLYYVDDDGAWDKYVYRWEKDSKGWWLARVKGKAFPKSRWCRIDGKLYYFDAKGYMVTGTKTIDDKIYSFDKDGALVG